MDYSEEQNLFLPDRATRDNVRANTFQTSHRCLWALGFHVRDGSNSDIWDSDDLPY